MRKPIKHFAATALEMSGLPSALEWLGKQPPNTLRVLSYHRVDWPEHRAHLLDPSLISATPEDFTRQMQFVSNRYCPISVDRLLEALRGDRPLPPRAILVTFDDAYRDFAENGWPVLKREEIPAVLFVSSAYPGDGSRVFWWDAVHQMLKGTDRREIILPRVGVLRLEGGKRVMAKKRLRRHLFGLGHDEIEACLAQLQCQLGVAPRRDDSLLTWEDLDRLATEGVTIASHTHSHAILTRLSDEQITWEAKMSQRWIHQQTGQAWPIFCYPDGWRGTFDRRTGRILKENGYVAAFTMVGGTNIVGQTPPLEMRRIGVDLGDPFQLFRLRLTLLYNRRYGISIHTADSSEIS